MPSLSSVRYVNLLVRSGDQTSCHAELFDSNVLTGHLRQEYREHEFHL